MLKAPYLPIEQLIAHPERLNLGGERRELTIFFSDLQGFTSISEGLSPEELTGLLNRHAFEERVNQALGIYEQPPLEGPRHPLRIDAAADVLLLEASYQRYGPEGQVNTAVDVAHDVEAIQRWSFAGVPLWQTAQHDHLLRDGADGSDLLDFAVWADGKLYMR